MQLLQLRASMWTTVMTYGNIINSSSPSLPEEDLYLRKGREGIRLPFGLVALVLRAAVGRNGGKVEGPGDRLDTSATSRQPPSVPGHPLPLMRYDLGPVICRGSDNRATDARHASGGRGTRSLDSCAIHVGSVGCRPGTAATSSQSVHPSCRHRGRQRVTNGAAPGITAVRALTPPGALVALTAPRRPGAPLAGRGWQLGRRKPGREHRVRFRTPLVLAPVKAASPSGDQPMPSAACTAGASLACWAPVSRQASPRASKNSPAPPPLAPPAAGRASCTGPAAVPW